MEVVLLSNYKCRTSSGQAISQFDLTIAVTALHHGMVLLSENRKHYERILNLKLQSINT